MVQFPGSFERIKTWHEFSQKTDNNGFLISKRGAKIKLVDKALEAYWLTPGAGSAPPPSTVDKHLELLGNLVQACLTWLKIKKGKTTTGKTGTNVNDRRKYISELANGALQNIGYIIYTHDLYRANLYGQYVFNKSKLGTLGVLEHGGSEHRTMVNNTINVDAHYKLERDMYLHNKAKNNVKTSISANRHIDMATYIKGGQVAENKFPAPQFGNKREQKAFTRNVNSAIRKVFRNDVERLTMDDYNLLDQLANVNEKRDFDVMAKDQRFAYMAIPGDRGLLYDMHDRLITTQNYQNNKNTDNMYAMDKYGNIIFKTTGGILQQNDVPVGRNANRFNHSSFNAAGEVICAGMIEIEKGKLKKIDNNSGHYKPSRDQLHKCVTILASDGVDLTECTVVIIEYKKGPYRFFDPPNWKTVTVMKMYSHLVPATTFLKDKDISTDDKGVADMDSLQGLL